MWYIYILQCADNTLYTGVTKDIKKRIFEHNNTSDGAKYTRTRRPVELVYFKEMENQSIVTKEEIRIKKLSRKEKLELIRKKI